MFSFTKTTRERRDSSNSDYTYVSLEQRRLLAVTATFADGMLDIAMTQSMDAAILTTNESNEVLVNSELVDTDAGLDGIQAATIDDVTDIVFSGGKAIDNLFVQLGGFFDNGNLNTLTMANINEVLLNGVYSMSSFDGSFVGDGGSISGPGEILVDDFQLTSSDQFAVTLGNNSNDFVNGISISTMGDVVLADINSIIFQDVNVGDLTASAEGMITDSKDSFIAGDRATLSGSLINLGNNGNAVDFDSVVSNTTGDFLFTDANSLAWAGASTVGSATLSVTDTLLTGPQSNIQIVGDGVFFGDIVRLGVGGSNLFNADRINANAGSNVFVWENSGIELFGFNSSPFFDLIATGDITNSAGTVLEVDGITSVQSTTSVSLGRSDGDTINTNSFQFFAPIVDLQEDSNTLITGFANFAETLTIESIGSITNADEAYIFVQDRANFVAIPTEGTSGASVEIGTRENDFFTAAAVTFDVISGNFTLSEDNDTILAGESRADAISVTSSGNITNGPQAEITVDTNASFNGMSIDLGGSDQDILDFGSLTVNSVLDTVVIQDSDVLLTGESLVDGQLILVSESGGISDSSSSNLSVGSLTSFIASTDILIGDDNADLFETSSVRFNADGNVNITHNGNLLLGANNLSMAAEISLTALATKTETGMISNLDGSILESLGDLTLSAAADIDLGNAAGDSIVFNDLNFNSPGNVNIVTDFASPEDSFFLFGTNTADELRLSTNVDVMDGTNAALIVGSFIEISARNITLGDTDTDCVVLPDVASQNFITTDQAADITEGGDC